MMKKYIYILYAFIILNTLNCKSQTDLEYENFGCYEVLVPKNWVKTGGKNADSRITIWNNLNDTLIIEHGKFISDFEDLAEVEEQFDLLNGYSVQKITSQSGLYGLFTGGDNAESSIKLTYLSKDKSNATFQKIYSSLKINKDCFSGYNSKMIGQIIYKRECLPCHGNINEGFNSITLSNLIKKKDNKWLMDWLKSKNFRNTHPTGSYTSFEGIKDMDCGIKPYDNQTLKSLVTYLRTSL